MCVRACVSVYLCALVCVCVFSRRQVTTSGSRYIQDDDGAWSDGLVSAVRLLFIVTIICILCVCVSLSPSFLPSV